MGRKVHPYGFRLGIIKDWQSRWYAENQRYTELVHRDRQIRERIFDRLKNADVARVEITRSGTRVDITIHTAKPGVVIGRRGASVEQLRKELAALEPGMDVRVNVEEIKTPELEAAIVAKTIAEQIERRVSYRRAMKRAVQQAMRAGAEGIKIRCAGRLGGAEMSRVVWEKAGRVPLHTIRADIDYAMVHAFTTYGVIGVKVWIYKGEVLPERASA